MKSIILIIIFFTIASCSENKTEKHVASKYKCLLDSISFEDTLYIIEEHDGCFDRGIKTIKIFKKNNFLFSIFRIRILDSNYVFNAYLKDTSVLAYKELENKIKENKEEMDECTTTSTISISVKNNTIKYIDRSCHFESYSNFLRKTFYIPRPQ